MIELSLIPQQHARFFFTVTCSTDVGGGGGGRRERGIHGEAKVNKTN